MQSVGFTTKSRCSCTDTAPLRSESNGGAQGARLRLPWFLLVAAEGLCVQSINETLVGSPRMWGARSNSARSRADGNTFGGSDLSGAGALLFAACGR